MSLHQSMPLDDVWRDCSEIFERVLNDVESGVEHKVFMKAYTNVFNFLCANSDGEVIYKRMGALLKQFVGKLVEQGKPMPDEALLIFFREKWNDFSLAMKMANGMLAYLNRTWIKVQKSNNADVYEIYMLADVVWRDSMFLPLKQRITSSMLNMIEKDRNGERVDYGVIADTTQCYVRLGLNRENPKENTLDVYKDHFEQDFLKATDVYYTVESTAFINENGVSAYMKRVEQRIDEEVHRCRTYLHRSTEAPLVAKLDDVLIRTHAAVLHQKCDEFLKDDKVDDLARMYKLLHRIRPAGLEPLKDVLEKHIAAYGAAAIENEAEEAAAKPEVFVAILLRVFRKFQELIEAAFSTRDAKDGEKRVPDPGFVAAQDKAFRTFVNDNAVTNPPPAPGAKPARRGQQQIAKAPQMLAKYCDMILKKGPTHISDEQQMEQTLSDVVALFKYLPDKDVFMLVYSKLLSKRLINDTSANDDFEASMINKLKVAQGSDYTMRLQRMIQDMQTSKDINDGFKSFCDDQSLRMPLDFAINVLATGCWPLQAPNTGFKVPAELHTVMDAFKKFYNTKYSGRKLTYLHHLSKGECVAAFAMKGRLRLTMSGFQMGMALVFNAAAGNIITLKDIKQATELQDTQLKVGMLGMLKIKIVKCSDAHHHQKWSDATKFMVNKDFKSKRNRVNANVPVDTGGLKSAPTAPVDAPEVRRERELKLQAAIVRIMKARKTLPHNELVAESTTQVQKWFAPQVATIKKVIEQLIEQEYLERVQDDNSSTRAYNYLA
mmetsp:Transcript_36846/g.90172  ORF Transcript_36846/g.90172 Transcript_36846/m.90172 type:complete len:775 (-) Transcript_36846:79-2403(-)|eukprot:CAMPEP_0198337564 /NCGR_PEP_ID=MMETSP1450-20131203/28711_1 /TAXON_ID=753684 ORGANISM="Madagascaria erythrocladiodes, Strain CCMP3234" /NCGR_SAMPLE_ID=MMETSP1450 /ASSEMBLY_ACC=CAM_ASM_001115 /LENGTH=774 /DNA_ID=CAMNT_0044042383 /DNA_START=146 /DNA_END=2470 /DNA_ORIENTATION=+